MAMRAMGVNGEDGCPKIEPDAVEYFFHCVSGNGPDSGWLAKPCWQSPKVADGKYVYQFRIRDKSPQHNETPYSSTEDVVVSPLTGYHDYALNKLAALPEGTLVSFKGNVTACEADHYAIAAGGATINVMPQTVGSATDPALKDRNVTVTGCVLICKTEKYITWADVK